MTRLPGGGGDGSGRPGTVDKLPNRRFVSYPLPVYHITKKDGLRTIRQEEQKMRKNVNHNDFIKVQRKLTYNFGKVRDKLIFEVVDVDKHPYKVKDMYHSDLGNGFAAAYKIYLSQDKHGCNTVEITEELAEEMEYDLDLIRFFACFSMSEIFPAKLVTLDCMEVDMDMSKPLPPVPKGEDEMYILSNGFSDLGASCLYYPMMKELLAYRLKCDYYALPTSRHEHLIIPDRDGKVKHSDLKMIFLAALMGVPKKDIISSKVLHYSRETRELTRVYSAAEGEQKSEGGECNDADSREEK